MTIALTTHVTLLSLGLGLWSLVKLYLEFHAPTVPRKLANILLIIAYVLVLISTVLTVTL
jgi:multisubunit Na+/H+ antiporter MnhG subunit